MVFYVVRVVCVLSLLVSPLMAQSGHIEPLRFTAGIVLSFHTQTRFDPVATNETDLLPKGTILRVKLLEPVDSTSDCDGAVFRGAILSPVVSGNQTVLHSESEVKVLLVLLRSRTYPDGFRYELLVTSVTDHGKSYDLTASLNPSFADTPPSRVAAPKVAVERPKSNPRTSETPTEKTPR